MKESNDVFITNTSFKGNMNNQEGKEKIITILEEINPDIDFETCTTLIDYQILDSFAILSIVGELQEKFNIYITPIDIKPENFDSEDVPWNMEQRLKRNN